MRAPHVPPKMGRSGYVEEDAAERAADQLSSWDSNTRRFALQSLGLLGPKAMEHLHAVAKLLEDEEPEVRKAACNALGRLGGGADDLAIALADQEAAVRAEAAQALGRLSKTQVKPHTLSRVVALAKDADQEAAAAGVSCLAAIGEAKALSNFTESAFPTVVRAAVMEMGRCPVARQEHAACLSKALAHQDASVRLAAAQASGELGGECSEEHLTSLTKRTEDPQVKVRRAAIQALGRAAPAGARRICAFFHDKDDSIRHFAAETLGANGNEAAAEVCAQLLHGTSGTVKCTSLLVASCLHDKDLQTRLAAIQALSDLGAESHADELEALADDESKGVRQAAVACLAKMGNAGARSACRFLEDQDPAVRQSAVRVYSPLHSKLKATLARPYADVVARRLLDEDWRVRLAAVVALGDLNAREFVEQIGALHHDSDLQVRRSALAALEKLSAPASLVAIFLGDEDEAVRKDAQKVYEALCIEEELSEAD